MLGTSPPGAVTGETRWCRDVALTGTVWDFCCIARFVAAEAEQRHASDVPFS